MMTDNKYNVHIKIVSESEDESTIQLAEGMLYEKSNHYYLRYEEPDRELGVVTCTMKFAPNQIKLMRRGAVESDMTFEAGVTHQGVYSTPFFHMELQTRTTEIIVQISEGKGKLAWSYYMNNMNEDTDSSMRQMSVWLS